MKQRGLYLTRELGHDLGHLGGGHILALPTECVANAIHKVVVAEEAEGMKGGSVSVLARRVWGLGGVLLPHPLESRMSRSPVRKYLSPLTKTSVITFLAVALGSV